MNLISTTRRQCWLPNAGCRHLLNVEKCGQNPLKRRRVFSQVTLKVEAVFSGREIDRRQLIPVGVPEEGVQVGGGVDQKETPKSDVV